MEIHGLSRTTTSLKGISLAQGSKRSTMKLRHEREKGECLCDV